MLIDLSIPSLVALGLAYGYWVYWFFLTITYLLKKNKDDTNISADDPPHMHACMKLWTRIKCYCGLHSTALAWIEDKYGTHAHCKHCGKMIYGIRRG